VGRAGHGLSRGQRRGSFGELSLFAALGLRGGFSSRGTVGLFGAADLLGTTSLLGTLTLISATNSFGAASLIGATDLLGAANSFGAASLIGAAGLLGAADLLDTTRLLGALAPVGAVQGDARPAWGRASGVVGRGLGVQLGCRFGGGLGGGCRFFYGGTLRRYRVLDGVEVGGRGGVVDPGIACRADEGRCQEGRGR
jgi:hypothetical protein